VRTRMFIHGMHARMAATKEHLQSAKRACGTRMHISAAHALCPRQLLDVTLGVTLGVTLVALLILCSTCKLGEDAGRYASRP
jgi:hypothetical protein